MKYWLFKSEPEHFSLDDLKRAKAKGTSWNEIRNYQARNFMRDEMKKGDLVLFYHSNANPPGAVGVAEVVREAHPDDLQFDASSPYYDPKATPDEPRWWMVDIRFRGAFDRSLALAELRETEGLEDMVLLKKGSRLSIQPVTKREFEVVCRKGGLKPASL